MIKFFVENKLLRIFQKQKKIKTIVTIVIEIKYTYTLKEKITTMKLCCITKLNI